MNKIILLLTVLFLSTTCFAGQVNIIMKDGTLKTGLLIGSDEEAYYIQNDKTLRELFFLLLIK